jgi:dipeptidyl aminopeptidase/acylaminoacyl peptidase
MACPRTVIIILVAGLVVGLPGLTALPAQAAPSAQDAAAAASFKTLDVAGYLDWEQVSEAQVSPDGSQIIYTRQWVDRMEDKWASALWIMNADGAKNRFLAKGSSARWSPDGTRIAYLAEGEPKGTQIFVRWMDAEGAASQITRVDEAPANIDWSADGRQIAFTMLVRKQDSWKIDMPAPPKGATWTEAPRIVETRNYRLDRQGFLEDGYTHLFIVTADGGTARQVTQGNWNVGGRPEGLPFGMKIDWTPDGEEIVFDGLREDDADDRYRESHIYAVNVKTQAIRQITKDKGPWTSPVVSPDGKTIACTGFAWTPQTYKTEEIHVIGRDGSGARRIAGELDRDPDNLRWAADGSGLYFTAEDRGSGNVLFAPLKGDVRRVTEGTHMLSLTSMAANGMAVGIRSTPQEPGDVVRFALAGPGAGAVTKLTHVNDDVLEGRRLGDVEEITYGSSGNTKVQGWIVKPPEFDAKKKYPLILHIHGGPHAMYNVAFSYSFQNLAANGYVVLYTNPRGSTGYGTDFGNAIDDAYPSVDYDDLMAGVDAVIARGYVDTSRMYVTGVSGGGVLSSWIIGHTDRFAAAAVRSPVINWISFAGTTDITAWGYARYRGAFWENPTHWLDHSPLMYVKNVKTPALMMTGVLDLRTPMGQTEEYYQALKALKIPTAMIRFNAEYHGTGSKPSNFMRTQLYIMNWFKRYTKP